MIDLASHSVAYSLWNVDLTAIDKQLASLASDPEVVQFSVTAVGYGKLREVTKPAGSLVDPVVRQQDINFVTAETGSQKIGEVRVVLTRELVEQAITKAHRAVWVLVAVTLVVLYIATFMLLRRMVSVPVNRLEAMVVRIASGDLDAECAVESGDELGRLAKRFNTMAKQLRESGESLRDSETRLQLVLDGSQLGSWDWDIETGEVIRNPRWAEMLGYSPEEIESSMTQWTNLLHPDDQTLAWESINDHLEGRLSAHEMEYRMRTKDGQDIWILDQAKIVSWDALGKPLRMCGTLRDITKRKQAEQDREKLQNQLIQAQKMESVGRLAGGVAHDYNNISSIIIGYSELALEKVEYDDPLHEDLIEILTAANRSTDITRQLLAFSRQQTIAPKTLDLNDTIGSMLKMLRRLIGEDIDLGWLPGDDVWPIKIDPSQVDQIMVNLCVNARDAIADVGKLTVETKNIKFDKDYCAEHQGFLPGEYVLLAVSDNGCGIAPEILEKIFEPFFTTKGLGKGTGLGLATVYGIVKQNNGFINVYSEQGNGTTIKIYFPQHSGQADVVIHEEVSEIPLSCGETILLVEDEGSILTLGKRILGDLGYTVLAATSPNEAINLAEEHSHEIKLLITDVIMPEMNGRELSEQLQMFYPNLKVLFMSGYTANVIAHLGVLNDGVCFLPKPFSKMEMAVKVREVLAGN
ncbi:PAS domain-containing protein [Desulforhopalus sp. 52FAK]